MVNINNNYKHLRLLLDNLRIHKYWNTESVSSLFLDNTHLIGDSCLLLTR